VAVLPPPVVLLWRAMPPVAVLPLPVVLESRALAPTAVLMSPVVLLKRAPAPRAVFSDVHIGTQVWAVAGSANARLSIRAHRIVSHTRIDLMEVSLSLPGGSATARAGCRVAIGARARSRPRGLVARHG
jgi:hypothetical protein